MKQFTLENQFKRFLDNHVSDPFIEEEEKMFESYTNFEEFDTIYLSVNTNRGKVIFNPSCYFVTDEGTPLYDFLLIEKATAHTR